MPDADYLYLTLQSQRGLKASDPSSGKPSPGAMLVDFGRLVFDAAIEVNYDLRAGGLDRPILCSASGTLETIDSVPWVKEAPAGAAIPSGVEQGFFPGCDDRIGVFALRGLGQDFTVQVVQSSA